VLHHKRCKHHRHFLSEELTHYLSGKKLANGCGCCRAIFRLKDYYCKHFDVFGQRKSATEQFLAVLSANYALHTPTYYHSQSPVVLSRRCVGVMCLVLTDELTTTYDCPPIPVMIKLLPTLQ